MKTTHLLNQWIGRSMRRFCFSIALMACMLCAGTPARSQEVAVVLSSELGPYREALEGFQEAFDDPIPVIMFSEGPPPIARSTRVIVAFGGKAAQWGYPDQAVLIYGLAPGTKLGLRDRKGVSVEVNFMPRPDTVFPLVKEIQPELRRLAIVWLSKTMESDVLEIERTAGAFGIEIVNERLENEKNLPDRLRTLHQQIDAIWLLPDPLLAKPQIFSSIKAFSWSNRVPFYVSVEGFVRKGATASVSSSYREIGRAAGLAARSALAGTIPDAVVYPGKTKVTVNPLAADQTGIDTTRPAFKQFEPVRP